MTDCALYCRLSYAPDGSLEKVERQEDDAREVAGRLGWHVGEVYADPNVSAWRRGVTRPAWERMLADIEAGRWPGIVVYHGDRLIRQPRDLEKLLDLAERQLLQLASVSGTRDLSNPDDRFILRIEAAQACRESDNTSRRVTRTAKAMAAKGRPQPGRFRGYGYEKDGTARPEEIAVVKEMSERILAGDSTRSLAVDLNGRGVPTVTGARWTRSTVRSILTHPRIAGFRVLKGDRITVGTWQAAIDLDTWEALQHVLTPRRRKDKGPPVARKHLLSGIAKCGPCGENLVAHKRSDRRHEYVYYCDNKQCPGPKVARSKGLLESYVEGRVLRRLNDDRFLDQLHAQPADTGVASELNTLQVRRDQLRHQLENLIDHPEVNPELIVKTMHDFDRRLEQLRAQTSTTARHRLLNRMAGISREQWDAEPLEVRKATVTALYRVIVLPSTKRGPGFDPASVELHPIPITVSR